MVVLAFLENLQVSILRKWLNLICNYEIENLISLVIVPRYFIFKPNRLFNQEKKPFIILEIEKH